VPNPTVLHCGRDWGALMVGALLGSLPVAVIYSFFVEYYVSGLTGAVKEQGR
jgi:multiple sugar transport system permease protein